MSAGGICTLLQAHDLSGGRVIHRAGQFPSVTFSPGNSQKTSISGIWPLGRFGYFMGHTSSIACWALLRKISTTTSVSFSAGLKCQSSALIFIGTLVLLVGWAYAQSLTRKRRLGKP